MLTFYILNGPFRVKNGGLTSDPGLSSGELLLAKQFVEIPWEEDVDGESKSIIVRY